MSDELRRLLDQLQPAPWRQQIGFSEEVSNTQRVLFDPASDPIPAISSWLQKCQPCLFGKIAAKLGLLRYCILRESDLTSDENVRDKIQAARRQWTKAGFDGKASGFIVLLISERLAAAVPDEKVFTIAQRLCSLYLREVAVERDKILLDELYLEKPGPERTTWVWPTGVNYFAAHGDKRWWQDHRIPGGIAFSVNSVGHLAKSGRIAQAINELNDDLGLDADEFPRGTIRTLDDALTYAMLTIHHASDAVSGKATELLPTPSVGVTEGLPACPFELPAKIAGKNHCTYSGWYHTDFTLPSEYFRPDVERPSDVVRHDLDFTYLFLSDVENPDYNTLGVGRQIRADGVTDSESRQTHSAKRSRMQPSVIPIDDCPRLVESLRD